MKTVDFRRYMALQYAPGIDTSSPLGLALAEGQGQAISELGQCIIGSHIAVRGSALLGNRLIQSGGSKVIQTWWGRGTVGAIAGGTSAGFKSVQDGDGVGDFTLKVLSGAGAGFSSTALLGNWSPANPHLVLLQCMGTGSAGNYFGQVAENAIDIQLGRRAMSVKDMFITDVDGTQIAISAVAAPISGILAGRFVSGLTQGTVGIGAEFLEGTAGAIGTGMIDYEAEAIINILLFGTP